MKVIPENFEEWRDCIEHKCHIPLTAEFAKQKLLVYDKELTCMEVNVTGTRKQLSDCISNKVGEFGEWCKPNPEDSRWFQISKSFSIALIACRFAWISAKKAIFI